MITIQSTIEGMQLRYGDLKRILSTESFQLGGGYEYDHGYMDRPLDLENEHGHHYYLRIPVRTISGELESEEAVVELGTPFLIRHEFVTGNDPTGDIGLVSAVVNQFSKPIPVDQDQIDPQWIDRARSVIASVEKKLKS
ncbi:YugN family protein [Staphylospora marina]|uniref:YugN family protein n=1 Tax=Staphylospora marina TaxID=2490858 RepID=UPI0013DE1D3F|nr:YugN family protein [Staphylospora marina]